MDISSIALWLVCGLGAPVFAVLPRPSLASALTGAALFVVGLWWGYQPFAPTAPLVALAVALSAAACLRRRQQPLLASASAGVLAGIWTRVLGDQGVPVAAAGVVALALPLFSAYLGLRDAAFAPAALHDEALLFLLLLSLGAAAAPGIGDGWRAALQLNLQGQNLQSASAGATAVPVWILMLAGAALASGGAFSLWSRR